MSAMIPKTTGTNKVALPLPAYCLMGSTMKKAGPSAGVQEISNLTAGGKSFELPA